MANWSDKSLIRIIKGYDSGKLREDIIAFKCKGGNSYRGDNCHIVRGYPRDSIDEWEEVTAVPTAALKRLQDAFRGIYVIESLEPPLLEALSYLPADKPSALDRAVATVKDIAGDPLVDAETLPADRLSLLMDALASVQSATRKTAPLAMVTRICADWVQADKEEVVAVEQMRSRARSMPEVIGSDPAKFLVLAGIVGETASMLGDGHPSVSGELINAGAYALAWAAQIIEEEGTHE